MDEIDRAAIRFVGWLCVIMGIGLTWGMLTQVAWVYLTGLPPGPVGPATALLIVGAIVLWINQDKEGDQ